MAEASLVFPTLPSGKNIDSSKFETSKTDPAMKADMDGGYTVTRARFTRKPRKIFKCGFTMISGADKGVLDDFWDAARGGARSFEWLCPMDGIKYQVRFDSTEMTFTYRGAGGNHFWDCSFSLKQV